jgi:hypothetical protein
MSGVSNRRSFHATLKDVTRRYGGAMDRYERAMQRGHVDQADDAIGDMQAIEQSIIVIEKPRRDR